MFEIVCEVANTTGKDITLELSIPEAEHPDVQIVKNGQQIGVFAGPNKSTVKINIVSTELSDRIEQLEAALRKIEQVGSAVENIALWQAQKIASAALGEKKDG
jgi:uncharacterized protein YllA (UPF0747 family)